jgi:hypothetical protein
MPRSWFNFPLVHPDLLNVLCQQRAVFHTIAANAIVPGTVAATVVCWADSILATLADTIAALAGGTSQNMPGSLGLQRDEDNLRAAAQLPCEYPSNLARSLLTVILDKWSAVMKVIGCDQTSPGALRIALRLAFAVVVLGPQHLDPWAASKSCLTLFAYVPI